MKVVWKVYQGCIKPVLNLYWWSMTNIVTESHKEYLNGTLYTFKIETPACVQEGQYCQLL